jgi:hypothetical protein
MGVDGIITDRSEEFSQSSAFLSPVRADDVKPTERVVVRTGCSAVLSAVAPVSMARSVEWRRGDDARVLGVGSRLMLTGSDPERYGRYVASWTQDGRVLSRSFEVAAGATDNQLINISARMMIGSGESTGIVGFVVKSNFAPRFLLRGVGPSLGQFGVSDAIPDPNLTLFRRSTVIDSEVMSSRILATGADFQRNGAFAFAPLSRDVAIMKNLVGGAYSVHLSSRSDQRGTALIEVYQDNNVANWGLGSPVNLSLRGRAVPGSPLIGGFVIPAGNSQTVLVRGIGPSLAGLGINEPLKDPVIRIYDSARSIVATNDDWWSEGDAETVERIGAEVGAFRILAGRDSAMLVSLPPGAYSAVLHDSVPSREGIGLLEIYAVTSGAELAGGL